MLLEHRGRRPVVPESAYVAPSATLCGAVVLGENARVLHGAVLTAEDGQSYAASSDDAVEVLACRAYRDRSVSPYPAREHLFHLTAARGGWERPLLRNLQSAAKGAR